MADGYVAYVAPGSSTWRSGVPVRRDADGVFGIKWTDLHTDEEWFEWYEDTDSDDS